VKSFCLERKQGQLLQSFRFIRMFQQKSKFPSSSLDMFPLNAENKGQPVHFTDCSLLRCGNERHLLISQECYKRRASSSGPNKFRCFPREYLASVHMLWRARLFRNDGNISESGLCCERRCAFGVRFDV
jgi:hypothetical protein